jgi:hypothetical protein
VRQRERHEIAQLDDPVADDHGEAQLAEDVRLEGCDVGIVLEDVGTLLLRVRRSRGHGACGLLVHARSL